VFIRPNAHERLTYIVKVYLSLRSWWWICSKAWGRCCGGHGSHGPSEILVGGSTIHLASPI